MENEVMETMDTNDAMENDECTALTDESSGEDVLAKALVIGGSMLVGGLLARGVPRVVNWGKNTLAKLKPKKDETPVEITAEEVEIEPVPEVKVEVVKTEQ